MNDFLEFAKDLETGHTPVTPDELAPEPVPTAEYDENKDPEMDHIEEQYRMEDARLRESIESDIRAYVASDANPTFKGMQNSDWANDKVTQARFDRDLKYLINREGVVPGSGSMGAKTGAGEGQYKKGESKTGKNTSNPGPYDSEINDDPDTSEMSSALSDLTTNYGDVSLKGSADEMFQDMQNIVKNILLRRSDKRHAIIFGDPGVGKCLAYNQKILINVEDIIANELCDYLDIQPYVREIEVEIGELFAFIEEQYNIEFAIDEFKEVPFILEIKDENDRWVRIPKLIMKEAPIWRTRFSNGLVLMAADNHIIDLDRERKLPKCVKDLIPGDKVDYLNCRVIDNEQITDIDYVYSPAVDSISHLYKTSDGLIHHNTYEVMETCKHFIGQSPSKAKFVYEAGDIGTSMSTLVPFFYKHSQNEIIVLDDNDKMIMANLPQDIMNILKALLDPKAAEEKPVTVRANMLKIFADRLSDLEEEPMKESKKGHWFEIDKEALREGQCIIAIDDEIVVNSPIRMTEAQKLSNMICEENQVRPIRETKNGYADSVEDLMKLYEAGKSNKEFLDEIVGDEDDEEYEGMAEEDKKAMKAMKKSGATEQGEGGGSFPRRFLFDSSVIFISNLDLDQINTAVLDRAESIEIRLSLQQYLERLGKIYGGLCKGSKFSEYPQELRDWAKKCVYTALGIVIEAKRKNAVIFKSPVEINRKLTFRMFDEFVNGWIRYAFDLSERRDGRDLSNKAYRDKLSQELLPDIIRRKILPWMKQRTRA